MLGLTGFLGLTRISFFLLPQIPLYCFVGGKSHRCFCVWAGSRGFHFAFGLTRISLFGLTRISQIPRCCFVGGKSHRWLCGCGLLGAARGSLSRTYLLDPSDKSDLSDKSDGLDIFKNNPWVGSVWGLRGIGICVRPRWTPCGRVTKLQKIVLFVGRFERFEKKVWKKLLH